MKAEDNCIGDGQRRPLNDSPDDAGKRDRFKSIKNLDSKKIEMLAEMVTLSVRIGYTYIQEGLCDFQQWSKVMKDEFVANSHLITALNLTDAEMNEFIKDTWNSSFTIGGETKLLKEWAFVLKTGKKSDIQCIEEKEKNMSSTRKVTDISIPRDENGEYLFTQVPAEQTYAYLNAQENLTSKEVEMFVSLNIQKAQKCMKELESKKPKPMSDLNEYLANKAKWEAERQQAQVDLDYWNQVRAIGKGKKARRYSKLSFNRSITWLLSFLVVLFMALTLFLLLNQRSDQKREFLNKISCIDYGVNNFIAYQVITEDGKRHDIKKSDVEKYGWSDYVKIYPEGKVRMRDNGNRDYAVPIDKVDYALGENLRLFTIRVVNIVNFQPKSVGDKVIKYQITTEDGKVHNVSKTNIEKYGWSGYAEDYPGATVRMRGVNNEDYDVPIDKVEYALSKNFRLFSIQFNSVEDAKFVLIRHSNGDVTMNGKTGYVTYLFTLPDGTKKNVQEAGVKKYGWDKFAQVLKGSTLYMKDEKGNRYQVPSDRINDAFAEGLSPFTTFMSNEQWNARNMKEALVQTSQDCLFTFAGSKKYMPYVVIITIGCILVGIWLVVLKAKKKRSDRIDVKTNTFEVKTAPIKKQLSHRSIYMKKGFYYLTLILLWMLGVLLVGLLLILFGVVPVISWAYSIGIACAQPLGWLISLGIVLLLRPIVYKFMFKERKVFRRTIAVIFFVLGVLSMIFKIGSAIYSRHVMDQLIENYDWESKYGQTKDEIF